MTDQYQIPPMPDPPPRKPRRWLYIVLGGVGAVVLLIIIGAVASGSKQQQAASSPAPSDSGPSAPAAPASSPPPGPSGPDMLQVGQSDLVNDSEHSSQATIKVSSVDTSTTPGDPSMGQPPQNGEYAVVHVEVSATGGSFDINPLDFYIVENSSHYNEGDGNAMEALSDPNQELSATTLNDGEHTSGPIAFDVPDAHGEVVYAPNMNSTPLAEWKF